jgi:DNA processing protein
MSHREYLVALYAFSEFGAARTNLLLSYFKSAKNIWNASFNDLSEVGLRKSVVEKFILYRNNFKPVNYFERLKKLNIGYLIKGDKDYPENLKELDDAPLVLYYRGELSKNDINAVAIVGSRKMTSYGKHVAEKFSRELATFGLTIVSGLARGVDTVAHWETLKAGGRTIAVVASGLDRIYPPENNGLVSEIIKKGGVIFSEYPLGYSALPANFPLRNRIISGLSKAVLVVEGYRKSGTLITASHAADQGKTVFAVPGPITSPASEAPFFLLQNGAKLATNIKDILDEINLQVKVDRDTVSRV